MHANYTVTSLISLCVLSVLLAYPSLSFANDSLQSFPELNAAGVLLVNNQGKSILAANENKAFIPASTTKLITAWLALTHWGADHHFQTHFYLDDLTDTLWIKGSGDPFLVAEELVVIAEKLKQLGLQNIKAIGLDVSFFQANLMVPGGSKTNNPYDAIPTAIAANFNTIEVKNIAGEILSAETQTPLTAIAKTIALQHNITGNSLRINTGTSSHIAEQYFAELIALFLRQQNITIGKQILWGEAPQQTPYYTHVNSKSLADIIRLMMKYSTNFIANQLVLILSAEHYQRPANFVDVQHYMQDTLKNHFDWHDFTLKEGAGLSRDNQLSPQQLVTLLNNFRPWKHLLPEVTTNIFAKSGTLNKVSTLTGYIVDNKQQWNPFALMMKHAVSNRRRDLIIHTISNK